MKILLADFGREMRGGQRQVLYLAKHLKDTGEFKPFIASPKNSPLLKKAEEMGIATEPLSGSSDWNPFVFLSIRSLILRENIAWVHTNDAKSASVGGMVRHFMKYSSKVMHTRRVSYPLGAGWSGQKYRIAHAVVAVSEEIRQNLEKSDVDPRILHTIHSGIDPTRYPRKQSSGSPKVIGIIGALSKQKGHSVLINALELLSKKPDAPEWKLMIVGDGKLRRQLENQARNCGIMDKTEFSGYVDSRDVLQKMDILAVPSQDGEGSSGVIKEAWATGLPLVVSDLPSNLELVKGNENGLVFPNGDEVTLAQSLESLMTDSGLCDRLVAEGDERIKSFTDKVMAEAYMRLYRSI